MFSGVILQRLLRQQHAYNNPRMTPTPTGNDVQGALKFGNLVDSPTATMTPTIMPTGGLCVSLQPPLRIDQSSPRAGLRDSRIAQQCRKEEPDVTEGKSGKRCGRMSMASIVLFRRYNAPSNIAAPAPLPSSAALAHHCVVYRGGTDRNTPLAPTQLTAGSHTLPATISQPS
ncbi:hypothetical protein K525DRAFT_285749 [Schizophyllum commune Loenen D]|nr:hypothetical protein K525DRAFT_285749 [Schizophyllum commune Loenen D]